MSSPFRSPKPATTNHVPSRTLSSTLDVPRVHKTPCQTQAFQPTGRRIPVARRLETLWRVYSNLRTECWDNAKHRGKSRGTTPTAVRPGWGRRVAGVPDRTYHPNSTTQLVVTHRGEYSAGTLARWRWAAPILLSSSNASSGRSKVSKLLWESVSELITRADVDVAAGFRSVASPACGCGTPLTRSPTRLQTCCTRPCGGHYP